MLQNFANQHDRDQLETEQKLWCRPVAQKRKVEEETC